MKKNQENPIAICVGHSRGDGGAVSTGGVNEWNYNSKLGRDVVIFLGALGIPAVLIDRYTQAGYGTAMKDLAGHLQSIGARAAVELHFNSATPTATGHEWLYWHSSVAGRALVQKLDTRMSGWLPEHKRRGLVAIAGKNSRGGLFLRGTHCPAVIAEPFFGSNPREWEFFEGAVADLAQVIADGIHDWIKP